MNKKTCAVALSLIASSAYGSPGFHPASDLDSHDRAQPVLETIKIAKWGSWSDANLPIKFAGPGLVEAPATIARIIRIDPLEMEWNIAPKELQRAEEGQPLIRAGLFRGLELNAPEPGILRHGLPIIHHGVARGRGNTSDMPAPRPSCIAAESTVDSIVDVNWDGWSTRHVKGGAGVNGEGWPLFDEEEEFLFLLFKSELVH